MEPGQIIKAARDKRDWSQERLAKECGISQPAIKKIEDGTTRKSKFLAIIAQKLDIPLSDLDPSLRPARLAPPADLDAMPKDVPVKGNAAGGTNADFYFNGETVDYAKRPPGIGPVAPVFALYVAGNSMYPRFSDGELIYATSARAPNIGDDIVVEMLPTSDGGDTAGYVKRLLKRTSTKIVCTQFNPKKTIEFELTKIKKVHRVIPWTELLGA